ncbi:hypothetical protein ACFL2T_05880 [Elusimicrobiota bacterium]
MAEDAQPGKEPLPQPDVMPTAQPAAQNADETIVEPRAAKAGDALFEKPAAVPVAEPLPDVAAKPAGKLDQFKEKLKPLLAKLAAKKKLVAIVGGVVVLVGIGGGVFMFMGKSEPPPPPPVAKPKPKPKPKAPEKVDLDKIKIPDQPLRGTVNGEAFSSDKAVFEIEAGLLSFQKGAGDSPDMEIKLYVPIKKGEKPAGMTFKKKLADTDAKPHASGFWKAAGGSGDQAKLEKGFQMILELGERKAGKISGKLFLLFPKQHKTRVEGKFIAQVIQSQAAIAAEKAAAAAKALEKPKVSMAKLRRSCTNELGILCNGQDGSVWDAIRCLKKNRSGVLKKCRRYLKAVKRWN